MALRTYVLAVALSFLAHAALGAELFDIPGGLMVRSLLDWENASALEIRVGGKPALVPVVGNHEFYLDFSLTNWKKIYDTPETEKHYYALDYPNFSLVVLDSNVEWMLPRHKRQQIAWLEERLKKYQEEKKTVFVT